MTMSNNEVEGHAYWRGKQRTIIGRNGECNTHMIRLNSLKSRYLQDLYTSLVDIQWRWTLVAFFMVFILCWTSFGLLYFLIMKFNGDDTRSEDDDTVPCIMNAKTFVAMFLYAVETQTTIGYGYRYTTEECPSAIIAMCIQSITGVMIQAFMVGVVFAKLTRSKNRKNTLTFSKIAVINIRNGKLCLEFRIADLRTSFIIGATVKAKFISYFISNEGEYSPYHQYELDVRSEGSESDSLFFMWPFTVVHVIDINSPLYGMSATEMMNNNFEIIVYLEGTCESTGTSVQARYSYVPNIILWGHRFMNIVKYSETSGTYEVDFEKFHCTKEVSTPVCSAENLYQEDMSENCNSKAIQDDTTVQI